LGAKILGELMSLLTNSLSNSYQKINGKWLIIAQAWKPGSNDGEVGKYAILADDLKLLHARGMGVQIAQLYEIVVPGLILSKHVFQGLRRRLYCDDVNDGDKSKLVFSRVPSFDVEINRSISNQNPEVVKRDTPKEKTFVVIVSPNIRHRDEFPQVDGWLDRWNWVPEDAGLPEAPDNWVDRYDSKIYSRS
jgi:hypothetical protein